MTAPKSRSGRWAAANPKRAAAHTKAYRERHPDRHLDQKLRSKYGISLAEYQALHEAQEGRCAICRRPETRTVRGRVQRLSVDHCHQTGRIRGLLCHTCNLTIGKFQDSVELLLAAAHYLGWQESTSEGDHASC